MQHMHTSDCATWPSNPIGCNSDWTITWKDRWSNGYTVNWDMAWQYSHITWNQPSDPFCHSFEGWNYNCSYKWNLLKWPLAVKGSVNILCSYTATPPRYRLWPKKGLSSSHIISNLSRALTQSHLIHPQNTPCLSHRLVGCLQRITHTVGGMPRKSCLWESQK